MFSILLPKIDITEGKVGAVALVLRPPPLNVCTGIEKSHFLKPDLGIFLQDEVTLGLLFHAV